MGVSHHPIVHHYATTAERPALLGAALRTPGVVVMGATTPFLIGAALLIVTAWQGARGANTMAAVAADGRTIPWSQEQAR